MSLNELLQEIREDTLRIATKRGATNVRVFGSVARGEADSESDIDLLVDLETLELAKRLRNLGVKQVPEYMSP